MTDVRDRPLRPRWSACAPARTTRSAGQPSVTGSPACTLTESSRTGRGDESGVRGRGGRPRLRQVRESLGRPGSERGDPLLGQPHRRGLGRASPRTGRPGRRPPRRRRHHGQHDEARDRRAGVDGRAVGATVTGTNRPAATVAPPRPPPTARRTDGSPPEPHAPGAGPRAGAASLSSARRASTAGSGRSTGRGVAAARSRACRSDGRSRRARARRPPPPDPWHRPRSAADRSQPGPPRPRPAAAASSGAGAPTGAAPPPTSASTGPPSVSTTSAAVRSPCARPPRVQSRERAGHRGQDADGLGVVQRPAGPEQHRKVDPGLGGHQGEDAPVGGLQHGSGHREVRVLDPGQRGGAPRWPRRPARAPTTPTAQRRPSGSRAVQRGRPSRVSSGPAAVRPGAHAGRRPGARGPRAPRDHPSSARSATEGCPQACGCAATATTPSRPRSCTRPGTSRVRTTRVSSSTPNATEEGDLGEEEQRDHRERAERRGEHQAGARDHAAGDGQPTADARNGCRADRLLAHAGHQEDRVVDPEGHQEHEGVQRHRGVGAGEAEHVVEDEGPDAEGRPERQQVRHHDDHRRHAPSAAGR